jgi:hypothetical protein
MIERDHIPLPIDEASFLSWHTNTSFPSEINISSSTSISTSTSSSLFAQMIILNRVFIEINDFHTSSIHNRHQHKTSTTTSSTTEQTIQALAHKLDTWHDSLPPHLHNTRANLQHYGAQGLGRIFVAVYLGYYHFGQLLFYQYLSSPSSTSHPGAQRRCLAYSTALCELVYASHCTPGCKVLYTMVGHNLVVASTIQIHTLLFSSSMADIAAAKMILTRNFELLLLLRNYWPVLEISFEAFRTFREACRRNMDTAFEMDEWMLRFLYGFANKVEDKEVFERAVAEGGTVEEIGFSPSEWLGRM